MWQPPPEHEPPVRFCKRFLPSRRYAFSWVVVGVTGVLASLLVFLVARGGGPFHPGWHPWGLLILGLGLTGMLLLYLAQRGRAAEDLARTAENYRRLVETMADGLGVQDEHGRVVYANLRLCELFGYSHAEIIGLPITDLVAEENLDEFKARMAMRRRGQVDPYEVVFKKKTGERFHALISPQLMLDEEGKFRGAFATIRDVTERKRAEEQLRESEALIRSVADNLPNGMLYQIVRDNDGGRRFTFVSDAVRRLYGCSPEEAMADANRIYGRLAEEDRRRVREEEESAFRAFSNFSTEVRVQNPAGDLRWSLFASSPRRLEDGTTRWDGIEIDITQRKSMAKKLEESEKRYRTLVESVSEGIGVMNEHGINTYANPRFCQMLGCTREEIEGKPRDFFFDEKSRQRFEARDADRRRGIPGSYELVLRTKAGKPLNALVSEQPLLDEAGIYRGSIGVIAEITELKRVEEDLRKVNAELTAMFEAYPDMSFRLAADGTVLNYRAAAARQQQMFLTPAEFIGRRGYDLLPPPGGERLREALAKLKATGKPVTMEYPIPRPGGVDIREARLSPLPNDEVLVIVRDITERKRVEEQVNALSLQLLRAQDEERKRIAHELHDELGQALAVTSMAAQRLHAKVPAAAAELHEMAEQLCHDIGRAIQTMRTMQRGLYPTVLDNLGLAVALDTLVSEFQERTEIACDLEMQGGPFHVDAERARAVYRIIQEALTNVAKHADAAQVDILVRRSGSRLYIQVEDDGGGIDPAKTTASTSYGLTGMRKRAELCGGSLTIQTRPGGGTRITAEIPLVTS